MRKMIIGALASLVAMTLSTTVFWAPKRKPKPC